MKNKKICGLCRNVNISVKLIDAVIISGLLVTAFMIFICAKW